MRTETSHNTPQTQISVHSNNLLPAELENNSKKWTVRDNLPPTVDRERFEKGAQVMNQILDQLKLAPNSITIAISDNRTAAKLIDFPVTGGDTPLYVLAYNLMFSINRFCLEKKTTPPIPHILLEQAIGTILDNRWLSMTDIVFFGRSLTKGGFRAAAKHMVEYPPLYYNAYSETWLSQCLQIYFKEKNESMAEAQKEVERQERLRRPTGETNPEIQAEIVKLAYERIRLIAPVTEQETENPKTEPVRPEPTQTDRQVFTQHLLPELMELNNAEILSMRNKLRQNGFSIWVLVEEFYETISPTSKSEIEQNKLAPEIESQLEAEFYAEFSKTDRGKKVLSGIELAKQTTNYDY